MKLFAEDGYLQPKIQVAGSLIVAVFWLANGLASVISPSTQGDRLFGTMQLIGVPAAIYSAWYGYRKMKRQGQPPEAMNQPNAAMTSARRWQDWIIVLCLNISLPAMLAYLRLTESTGSAILLVFICCLVLINAVVLLSVRARSRRRGEAMTPRLMVGTVALGILSVLATAGIALLMPAPIDPVKLAYSSTPLSEIRPEQKRLVVELLRQKEQNSQAYGRVAANTKPMNPPLYGVDSFANANVINSTSAALRQSLDMDFSYFDQQQKAEREFRNRMMRIDPRSEFLREVQSQSDIEVSANAIEREWAASAIALYAFAADHAKYMAVHNRNLTFSDDSAPEFMKRYDASKALYERFQEKVQASIAERKRSRAAAGLDK